ncbi:MAG: heme-binding domain-containing protein [Candidatus Binataceae bacterium]
MNTRKVSWIALGFCAASLLAAQIVQMPPLNTGAAGGLTTPAPVKSLLERSCYDCHSRQTRWPWYSHVAPVSWLIYRDVEQGRKQINFSDWASYHPITKRHKLQWMGRALREENMPPLHYLLLHPRARLSPGDRELLERWIDAELAHS